MRRYLDNCPKSKVQSRKLQMENFRTYYNVFQLDVFETLRL